MSDEDTAARIDGLAGALHRLVDQPDLPPDDRLLLFRDQLVTRTARLVAAREKALLLEVLRRYEDALGTLRDGLERNDRAQKGYRLPLDRAWADHAGGFVALGNWLDAEIDKRFEAGRAA